MNVGAKWKVFIPAELGYGEHVQPGGKIKANMALVFEIELLGIEPETAGKEPEKMPAQGFMPPKPKKK
jgi:hypothetical protein